MMLAPLLAWDVSDTESLAIVEIFLFQAYGFGIFLVICVVRYMIVHVEELYHQRMIHIVIYM